MGDIKRHMQVGSTGIADGALDTVDIKDASITAAKITSNTLGSQLLGTTVGIIVAGTQIKDDLITEAHVLDHTLGSHNLATASAMIIAGTQIKDAIVTPAKFSVLQEYGTIAAVTATGIWLTFDTAFSAPPTVVVTGIDAAARLANAPVAGSAKIELGAAGTAVVHYIAWGTR